MQLNVKSFPGQRVAYRMTRVGREAYHGGGGDSEEWWGSLTWPTRCTETLKDLWVLRDVLRSKIRLWYREHTPCAEPVWVLYSYGIFILFSGAPSVLQMHCCCRLLLCFVQPTLIVKLGTGCDCLHLIESKNERFQFKSWKVYLVICWNH